MSSPRLEPISEEEMESPIRNTPSGNTPSGNTPSYQTPRTAFSVYEKRIGEGCYRGYEEITDRLCYANTLQDDHADLQEGMRVMKNEMIRLRELVSQKQ